MADADELDSVVESVAGSAASSSGSAVTVDSTIGIDDIFPGLARQDTARAARNPPSRAC